MLKTTTVFVIALLALVPAAFAYNMVDASQYAQQSGMENDAAVGGILLPIVIGIGILLVLALGGAWLNGCFGPKPTGAGRLGGYRGFDQCMEGCQSVQDVDTCEEGCRLQYGM